MAAHGPRLQRVIDPYCAGRVARAGGGGGQAEPSHSGSLLLLAGEIAETKLVNKHMNTNGLPDAEGVATPASDPATSTRPWSAPSAGDVGETLQSGLGGRRFEMAKQNRKARSAALKIAKDRCSDAAQAAGIARARYSEYVPAEAVDEELLARTLSDARQDVPLLVEVVMNDDVVSVTDRQRLEVLRSVKKNLLDCICDHVNKTEIDSDSEDVITE